MTPSAPAQPLAGAASARPPARLDGLGNRFVELFGRKLTRDDFAQEVARLVAEAARGKAAAVLAYESSRDRLLLLGDHGLSNDARAALGNGGECGWDIPLRSIHNRRISVIAAAHQNPFVPRALGALSAGGLSIAFLPLYNGSEPAGLVMIFSGGRSAFPDAQLQTVGQALRVCARALREPLELGGHDTFFPVAGEGDVEATAPAPIAAPAGAAPTTGGRRSSSPLRSTPLQLVEGAAPAAVAATEDGSADGLARIRDLEAQLGRAREELERHAQRMRGLNAAANALERERDDLAQRMADRERERETESSELRAQVGALQERLLATESERARHQRIGEAQRLQNTQTITSLETERDTLLERARVAEACAAELQTALTTVRGERERFAVQTEKLSGQLRITHDAAERAQARHAQERGTIETDRNAWKEQAITLRSQLAERTDALATTDRELRSVKVAHEGATTQLQQAREELAQLTALTETLERTATERDAARLQALAEAAALRRTLEEERSNHRQAEQTFRDTLDNVHQEADRLWSEAAARRADLASRDATLQDREEQLARLREQLAAVQEAASALERANADRDAQISTLAAQLEQGNAERQQLAEDRTALRVTLAEVRQRAGQADVEHTTVLAQLQAESGQLRAQVEGLNSGRTALSTRLERAVEESKHLARRLGESQSRTEELGQLLRQRDASIEAVTLERQSLEGRVAALSGQLQAAQEAAERAATRGAQEYARLEAERDEWHTHTAAAQHELAERTQQVIALEGELRSTAVARDAAATDLEVAQTELARLTTQNEALARAAAQQESAQAESAALSAALEEERAARARIEPALRAELAAAVARSEHLSTSAAALRDELAAAEHAAADRDDHLNALGREIEALRQQSADRGVLAHHAAELDHRVVELEQLLAAARGTQEAAERHAAALAEKLDAAQRREADAAALATRQHTALHDEILGLTDERDRLRTEHAAAVHEIEAQRATLAALQAAEAQLRGERAHTEEERQATGRRLAAAQQGLAELRQTLLDRDTSLAAAVAERDRANAQLITLTADLETGLQAMTAAQQRWIEDRRALAGERDARQQALAAARAEAQRLTVALHEMRNRAAAAATARTTALAERAELHEALETERAMAAAGAERLRAEVAAVHAREEQLASEVLDLRTTLADRDTLLSVLQERGAADQEASGAAQRTAAALEARTAELAARLQQTIAEMEQLRESRATLEHQLALVTATHGEEEQALAQGMQAAREQVAQLEEERSTLRAALSELRQQLRRTETSHDAARTQLQGEVADWQRQVDGLTASRAALAEDLARAQEELAAQRQHTRAEGERAAALATQQVELQRALADQQAATDATLAEMRETLAARTAELEERAAQHEQLRELHTSVTQQLDALAADHDAQNAATALERETVHHRLRQLEEERAALQRAWSEKEQRFNDAAAAQRAALADARHETAELRDHVADLTASRESLRARLEATEAGVTAHRAELDAAAQQAAALGEQRTQLHEALRTADARRTALEAELGQARTEIDALRQQSADRGVLAHQASQLGNRVTELEQQLAAVRGDAARAERQRTALNEELEAARRLQADAETTATRKHAELRAALERLDDERQRLEKERAAALAEAEGQRATAADMQTRLLRAEQDAHTLAQRLAAAQQRSEELGSQLHERDATLDTAGAERTRLLAQVANLTGRIRADQETLESLQGRYALEHAALEAERNAWKDKVERGRDQSAQLATRHEQLTQTAADLEAARNAAVAENASLQRTLDELRAAYHQTETALRADLGATQSESERLAGEADALRDALAERTALLATVQQERDATRQADLASQQALSAVRAEVAANRAQLAEAGEDIQRLRAEREGVAQQLGARHQEQEALARAAREARDQVAHLEQELGTTRDALAASAQQLTHIQTTHADTVARMGAEAAELQRQLQTLTAARDDLAGHRQRTEQLLHRQAAEREEDNRRALALEQRCAELEQLLATTEARRGALDAQITTLGGALDSARQDSADREELAQQHSTLRTTVAELESALATLREEGARTAQEYAAVEQALDVLREEHAHACAAAERERATLQEALQRLTDERSRLEAESTMQRGELQAQRLTLGALQTTIEQLRAERAATDTDAQQRLETLHEQLRQQELTFASTSSERSQLAEALRTAESSVAAVAAERDEWRRRADRAEQLAQEYANRATDGAPIGEFTVWMARDEKRPDAEGPLIIERSAPLDTLLDAATDTADTPPAEPGVEVEEEDLGLAGELVLLDTGARGDEACAALQNAGFKATRIAPAEVDMDDLAQRRLNCVMLNLAAGPAAWHTLKRLRERPETSRVPILAYLMGPTAQKGFCFGRADFAIWPMPAEPFVERLTDLRPGMKRLLVVSADIDGIGRIRESLTKIGVSISNVVDGKQAVEFATMVKPEAAVLHLAPDAPGAARAISGLRADPSLCRLPLLVLLDKAPTREEAFFGATARELSLRGTFQFTQLPNEIAQLLG